MEFKQASNFVIPWGDYLGQTIDKVAQTDKGLKDLDRLLEWMESKKQRSTFRTALETYLGDPTIKKELDQL